MSYFYCGLLVFFVLHFVTLTPALRRRIVARSGENVWKLVVAIGSFGGLALLVVGWSAAPTDPLFAPNALAIRLAPWLVSAALVLVLIGGGSLPGHLRRTLRHPMLIGVIVWSATHLLANGGRRETLLFGGFLVFSLYALGSLLLVGKRANFVPKWTWDAVGIGGGLVLAVGLMHGHRWLFGVAVA